MFKKPFQDDFEHVEYAEALRGSCCYAFSGIVKVTVSIAHLFSFRMIVAYKIITFKLTKNYFA
jgi:hypothetical protein